jgi:hypothetical protein
MRCPGRSVWCVGSERRPIAHSHELHRQRRLELYNYTKAAIAAGQCERCDYGAGALIETGIAADALTVLSSLSIVGRPRRSCRACPVQYDRASGRNVRPDSGDWIAEADFTNRWPPSTSARPAR